MTEIDIFKDYLSLKTADEKEAASCLKELEKLLGDAESSHLRIRFLRELMDIGESSHSLSVSSIADPLSLEQHIACVEKGFVQAYKDNDVKIEQLLQLAHSIEGLVNFNGSLMEIPKYRQASCWQKALEVPFEVNEVNFGRIYRSSLKEDALNRLASEWVNWVNTMFPRQKKVAMGFRNAVKTKRKPTLNLDAKVPHSDKIVDQLSRLLLMLDNIPEGEIKSLMKRIPWDSLKKLVSTKPTWRDFLNETSKQLKGSFSKDELSMLIKYLKTDSDYFHQHKKETTLFSLLLSSAEMSE